MKDEPTTQQAEPTQPTPGDAWRDVGKQFEALGQSLATAFRTAWESEENRKRMKGMQTGLEAMVNQVGQAIREASESPEGQQARAQVQQAGQSIRAAGQQTWQEAQPHLVSALRQVSAELQKMINQLEQEESASNAAAPGTPSQPNAE